MKKLYIVQLDNNSIRTIFSFDIIKVGYIVEDENWLGKIIKGGRVIKIYK